MKFNKVYEECTGQADVQGVPKKVGSMVRRVVKNPITKISKKLKKR